jgi:ubiquinone/menaquinone biosynthesis C-methylase UbiE
LNRTPDYGNWIRQRKVYTFLGLGLLLFLAGMIPSHALIRILLISAAAIFIGLGVYLAYITRQFSETGGGFQAKLWQAVIDHLDWDGNGQALDIGTGNGPLAIRLAKQYPQARVTGIDFWGSDWEYSQNACERNALAEGVSERTEFRKASASHLPFEDEQFDAVVSHFVFHEVADAADKRDVIKEALRVLKRGGSFSFQDLFLDEELYGNATDLAETIRNWGVQEVKFVDTHEFLSIPALLNTRRVLGNSSIICGKK